MINRREGMQGAAAAAMTVAAQGQTTAGGAKNIVISSSNGLRATKRAMDLLKSGADTLDAVIAGVNINEEDPEETGVGYGGLPHEQGVVEPGAGVMHGPSRPCGAVDP